MENSVDRTKPSGSIPANAHAWTARRAHWITPRAGGEGAARDACDLLLEAQDKVSSILADVGASP